MGIGCTLPAQEIAKDPKNSPMIFQVACQIAEGRDIAWSRPLGEQEVKRGIGHPKRGTVDRDEQSGFERHLLFLSFPSRGVEFTERHPSRQRVGNVSFPFAGRQGVYRGGRGKRKYELHPGDSIYFEADVSTDSFMRGMGNAVRSGDRFQPGKVTGRSGLRLQREGMQLLTTRVTERLGIRYPIVQAGMAGGTTTPELVAAVSDAGGLGTLGAGYMSG